MIIYLHHYYMNFEVLENPRTDTQHFLEFRVLYEVL